LNDVGHNDNINDGADKSLNDRIDFTGDIDKNKNNGKSETNLQLHIAEDRKPIRKLNNANGGA
jgi:hypothetical protein